MKQAAMSMIPILLAISMGTGQDNAAAEKTAAEQTTAAEEATSDAPQTSPLDELEWMVGQWVDQGEDSTITTKCSWTKNRKFLTRSFSVTIEGQSGKVYSFPGAPPIVLVRVKDRALSSAPRRPWRPP